MHVSENPQLVHCRCCNGLVSDQAKSCPHCGQPEPGPTASWEFEAREPLRQGKKIDAVKVVRQHTGMGLAETTHLVESWERGA